MYTETKIKQNLSWVVKADQEDKVIDKQELNLIWALFEEAEATLKGRDLESFQDPPIDRLGLVDFLTRLQYVENNYLDGLSAGSDVIDVFATKYSLNTRQEAKLRGIVKDASDAVGFNSTSNTYQVADDWTIQWENKK